VQFREHAHAQYVVEVDFMVEVLQLLLLDLEHFAHVCVQLLLELLKVEQVGLF